METLKIAATHQVPLFISRYTIWKDYQNFSNGTNEPYCIVDAVDGLPCFHHTEVSSINNCNSDTIVIDAMTESIHYEREFKQYNPSKRYIIFSGGWWDNNRYLTGYNYTLIHHPFFLLEYADSCNSPNRFSYYVDKTYDFEYPKPYTFCSTIGNVREGRTEFVQTLENTLSFDDYILRYSGQDRGQKSHHLDLINIAPGEFDPYTPILEKYYYHFSRTFPIAIYNSSYFNVVVETNIDLEDSFFLTEKTLKAVITGQPFVVLTASNFFKRYHELGFESYSSLWDESYDDEPDFTKRCQKIADLVNNLKSFDWEKHRAQLEYIALKNRSNFLNFNKVLDKEYYNLEKTISEMNTL